MQQWVDGMSLASRIAAFWLLSGFAAAAVVDIIIYTMKLPVEPVSRYFTQMTSDYPILAIGIGFVLGHLLWPQNVHLPPR
jgi:hypothetical protein